MYYKFSLEPLPKVTEVSKVVRKTTWRCADKRNIIVFMQEGSCYFCIDGQNILLDRGEALLIPAETPYVRKPYNDTVSTIFYVHFLTEKPLVRISEEDMREELFQIMEQEAGRTPSSSIDPGTMGQTIYLTQKMVFPQEYDRILERLRIMRNDSIKNLNYYSQLVTSLSLSKLLVNLSQMVISAVDISDYKKASIPQPLQKALLYVQKHYKQRISVEELSDAAGVSVQHIIRLFRKHLGTTPVGYINRTKVLHAIDMLRNTELTVQEIAYELGFDNPNYFSRLFKKEEKMSPLDTRKRIRNFSKDKKPSPIQE